MRTPDTERASEKRPPCDCPVSDAVWVDKSRHLVLR